MGRVLFVDIIIQPFVEDSTDQDLDGQVSSSVEWRLFVLYAVCFWLDLKIVHGITVLTNFT